MIIHRSGRRRRGFTLVEVLASMAVFTIVVPFAMRSAVLAERAASHARHQAEAASLGEATLNEILQFDWTQSPQQGDFSDNGYPEYRWQLQSQQQDLGITTLTMTVSWKEAGQDRSLNLSTFVYQATGTGDSGQSTGGTQ